MLIRKRVFPLDSEFKVVLNSLDKCKKFARICETCPVDVDVSCGRYMVDGKSILGLLSFDLCKPLTVEIRTTDTSVIEEFRKNISSIILK